MRLKFFMNMNPPETTHQQKKVRVVNGKPYFYEPPKLAAARELLTAALTEHKPVRPMEGPVKLIVFWEFPCGKTHKDGEWRVTRPDADNLNKLLKDCMTAAGYWKDDAQVVHEVIYKYWKKKPGIFIGVNELEAHDCDSCKHYAQGNGVCCNPDSEWCADFRSPEDSCGEWTE